MIHEHTQQEEDERAAAIDVMRLELELETRDFDEWLSQSVDDPNPNRWRPRHG